MVAKGEGKHGKLGKGVKNIPCKDKSGNLKILLKSVDYRGIL